MTLDQVANVRAGHGFRGAIAPAEDGNGLVIQPRDQSADGRINWANLIKAQVTGRKPPEWLKDGDILFLARGGNNVASLLAGVSQPVVCSPYFYVIEVKDNSVILPSFLAWQLNQAAAQRYFQMSGEGSVQLSIRRTILENTPIALPPLSQQQQIMQLVQCAEQEQQAFQRLIELRQQEINAVTQNLFN
ncbi:restriction endonuclease subunit S [uncultured Ferrimonas sp.]|uniref:restriction endonuclease subunit S n=1 Tax=uncultured Ferrimonas sp. TaxID=432640 RepID=UPI00262122A8|nr:restriction endonuclease subunit S [uncultured Ferrimonas sp.]